jgi:hypothetical protein
MVENIRLFASAPWGLLNYMQAGRIIFYLAKEENKGKPSADCRSGLVRNGGCH